MAQEFPIGFGVGIVNPYTRNKKLHATTTIKGILSSVKHLKISPTLTYRNNAHEVTEYAYQRGIRIFDTARIYGYSEYELGKMISLHNREELFICTKVSDMDLTREGGAATVRGNLENSLKDLNTDYVDLYLLHWPSGEWLDMYAQMDELYKEGKTKHIGVCNFKLSDFKKLEERSNLTMPQYCQIECHPFCQNSETLKYCEAHGIQVLAHTPTARMKKGLLENSVLLDIAGKHGKSVPQIVLRWHVQSGRIPITHTKKSAHLDDNTSIFDFELSAEEIERINRLNKEESFFRFVGIDNPNYKYNK